MNLQYGSGENKAGLSESDFDRLLVGLSNYDEDDLKQHQKKLWVLIGLATGTRGQEQHMLEVRHIVKDVCGPEHPKAGMMFYAIVGLNHKRGKLSTTNVWADSDDGMKMLLYCMKKNGLCAAGCLDRYLDKLAPGQLRLYCRVKKDGTMSPIQPLGRNTCSKMVQEVGVECGIQDMKKWKPHVFRSKFLTFLANDPNLNLAEVMAAGRHRSVAASLAYQRRTGESESAKFDSVERAMKRKVDDDDDSGDEEHNHDAKSVPEKKRKMADGKAMAVKSDVPVVVKLKTVGDVMDMPKREGEGGGDVHDDMDKGSPEMAESASKADSSSPLSIKDEKTGSTKPVSFTFHFN